MRKIVLIVLGVIIVVGGAGIIIFYQPTSGSITGSNLKSTNPEGKNGPGNSSNSTSSNSTSNKQGGSSDVNNDIVKTATNPILGKYLTDGNNRTLYIYDQDKDGASNCEEDCLAAWPAFTTDDTPAPDAMPSNFDIYLRPDTSTSQYTYKNKPLYFFSSDASGEIYGDGVDGFHLAKP